MRHWMWAPAVVALVAIRAGAADTAADLRTRFDAAVATGLDADAQTAGKKLVADFPEDPSVLHVLRTFHENDWKWPRLRTPFAVLYRWQNDIDDASEPDFRYALVDVLEDQFPKEDFAKEGGSLYVRQWCRMRAHRWDESVAIGKEFLRRFSDSSMVGKCRWALALALLGKSPPETDAAKKHLEWLAADPSRWRSADAKRRLDALRAGVGWIDVADGCPRATGLGVTAVLTDLAESDPRWKALDEWRAARKATVLRFRPGRLSRIEPALRKLGPEFVAFAIAPETLDANFQWEALDLCRGLDDDPLPDFTYGYLVARDTADMKALAAAALAPRQPEPNLRFGVTGAKMEALAKCDAFLHFGHGTPTAVVSGWTAAEVTAMSLPRGPLVVSGACFNGVTSRSYEGCTTLPNVTAPQSYAAHDVISLAWVHASAAGVLAALEGDRGEMAAQEWQLLRETACTAGDAVALQYRLASMALPDGATMPRYSVGGRRSLALLDVMLRGATSRVLIGDPTLRVLAKPVAGPFSTASATFDAATKSWSATVQVAPGIDPSDAAMAFTNTITPSGMGNQGFTERRVFARIAVPAEIDDPPGAPEAKAQRASGAVNLLRTSVRHEVWGGRRFVCVQAESADLGLSSPGATVTFTFPAAK